MKLPLLALALSILPASAQMDEASKSVIADNAQLLFIGDSITHGFGDPSVIPGDHFHGLLQLYFTLHFPEKDIWTANAGRAGDNLGGLLKERMDDKDAFITLAGVTEKATVAFIMYGMNDGGSLGYLKKDKPPSDESKNKRRNDYRSRLTAAIAKIKERDILPIVLSPSMYDETVKKNVSPAYGFNGELATYTEIASEVAEESGVAFIDIHTLMTELNAAKQKDDPKFSYTRDRVHPHSGGAALMMHSILKALGLESQVFDVAIDATPPSVKSATNAAVTDLKKAGATFTWKSSENSLPLPMDRKTYRFDNAFADIPFQKDFNRQSLKISNLPQGEYTLEIDGKETGKFTAENLAEGIDLAELTTTPQYATALEIRKKLFRKQELEILKRDINSYRLNLEGHFRQDIKRKDEAISKEFETMDWNRPDSERILALLERHITEKKADNKGTGGFFGFVAGRTRRNLANIPEINTELAAIREEMESLPATRQYSYSLTPTK